MTYARPQDPADAFDSEACYAPYRHFQDVTLGNNGQLTPPPPGQATGRLRNLETLSYLESKALVANVRPDGRGGYTYSPVS